MSTKESKHETLDIQKPMEVYTLFKSPVFECYDISPFCTKFIVYLHYKKTPNMTVKDFSVHQGSPKSGTGKYPFIVIDDQQYYDSSEMINMFENGLPEEEQMNYGMSPSDLAIATAFTRMIEESLYFTALIARRWFFDFDITKTVYDGFLGNIWGWVQGIIWGQAQSKAITDLKGQGTGKMTEDEINAKAMLEIESIGDFLGDKDFFMGDQMRLVDITVFAFLWQMWADSEFYTECPVRKRLLEMKNVEAYLQRVKSVIGFEEQEEKEESKQETD